MEKKDCSCTRANARSVLPNNSILDDYADIRLTFPRERVRGISPCPEFLARWSERDYS